MQTTTTGKLLDGPGRYLSATGLADLLSVSRATVRRLAADGTIPPPLRIGRMRRYDVRAVLDALRADEAVRGRPSASRTTTGDKP